MSLCSAKQPHPQAGGRGTSHTPIPVASAHPRSPSLYLESEGSPCSQRHGWEQSPSQTRFAPAFPHRPEGGPRRGSTTAPHPGDTSRHNPGEASAAGGRREAGAGGEAPGAPGRVHAGKMLNLSSLFGAQFPHPAPRGNREQGAGDKCQRGRPERREHSEKAEQGQS